MQVVPAECRHEILGTKLEVKMKKARAAAWPTLEASAQKIAANFSNTAVEQPPVYPSSHPRCGSTAGSCIGENCSTSPMNDHLNVERRSLKYMSEWTKCCTL